MSGLAINNATLERKLPLGKNGIHEKSGSRFVAYREKMGKVNGDWRNITLLERRSRKII